MPEDQEFSPPEPLPSEAAAALEEETRIAEAIAAVAPEDDDDVLFFLEQYGTGYSLEVAQDMAGISYTIARRLARNFDRVLAGETALTGPPARRKRAPARQELELDEETPGTDTEAFTSSGNPVPISGPATIQTQHESGVLSVEECILAEMEQSALAIDATRELLRQFNADEARTHEVASILQNADLTPRELEVLALRIHQALSQTEAGLRLGVSRAFAGRIERQGLTKIYRRLLADQPMRERLAEITMVLEEVAAEDTTHQRQAWALTAELFATDPTTADALLASPHLTNQERTILSLRWDNQAYFTIAQALGIDVIAVRYQEGVAYSKFWMLAQLNPDLRNLLMTVGEASDFPRRASTLKPAQEAQVPVKRLYDAGYHESLRLVLRQAGIQPMHFPLLLQLIGAEVSGHIIAESPEFAPNSAAAVANVKAKSLKQLHAALPGITMRNPVFAALATELAFAHLPQVATGLAQTYPPA